MSLGIDIGSKNLAICAIECTSPYLWQVVDLTKGDDVASSLIKTIDDWILFLAAHPNGLQYWKTIVIERQPKRCGRLQSNIQEWIYILFRDRLPQANVRIIHPNAKWGAFSIGLDLSTYTKRKKAAISVVKTLVNDDQWPNSKKQDDLADSFLLALRGTIFSSERRNVH
jgi:hypothetical protein